LRLRRPPALGAFDDQPVGAAIDGALGLVHAPDLVVVLDPRVAGPPGDRRRIADAGGHERRAPVQDPVEHFIDSFLLLEHAQEHLEAERGVGALAD
jgi:hypothetical protein